MTILETRQGGRRWVGAAGAAVTLALLGLGVPVALAQLAGNPLPGSVPHLDEVLAALAGRDDGTLFMRMLVVVGWLAWASFAVSVVLEVAGRLGHAIPLLPGLRAQQRLAAVLIGALLTAGAAAGFASSDAAPAAAAATTPQDVAPVRAGSVPASAVHLVERGEALLDLQDRYGVAWQRIAEANYGVRQADGRCLERGLTRIYPGWQLRIPAGSGGGSGQAAAPADREQQLPQQQLVHTVAAGDWLWHIAERYLGDPHRFSDIAALNPQYAERASGDGRLAFPDYLEPGWTLTLPADAVDRGAMPHATGAQVTSPDRPQPDVEPELQPEPEPAPHAEPEPDPEATPRLGPPAERFAEQVSPEQLVPEPAAPPAPAPPGSPATANPATASSPASEAIEDAGFGPDRDSVDRQVPVALAGAGLLAALVLSLAAGYRHRRRQQHVPGTVLAAASQRLERTLRVAQQPLDVERLDAALRALASALADRPGELPDVAGVLLADGEVRLLLSAACLSPPAPWQDHGDRWLLPAGEELPAPGPVLAPLPALVTVGSQAGRHVLLDLERLGVLTLYGDPERTTQLMRYLAAELACHTWSDATEVLIAGFCPADAELLAGLRPDRVRVLPSIIEGVELLRRRVAAARTALQHTGAADAFTGRVRGLAGDAWMPQVLLAAAPDDAERAALGQLRAELAAAGRCAVAAVTTGGHTPTAGRWRVTVTADGALHLRLPFLHGCLAAAGLTRDELAGIVEELHHAQVGAAVPAPVVPLSPTPQPAEPPAATPPTAASTVPPDDPYLDTDLAAWHADDPGRPRIAILGPVRIDASGIPPDQRQRLHTELIVFLAQRGAPGADPAALREALWPGQDISDAQWQLAIARARRWLGTDAGGDPWLAEVGADLTYRLAEGYLLDWQLFRRLRARGEQHREVADLRAALHLVRGVPLHRSTRPSTPGARNPYPWLPGSHIHPDHLVAAIVDTSHVLAELCLEAGDTAMARWAVQQAWLADADRGYDQPWRDLLLAAHADGATDELRTTLTELLEARDAEAPEDLHPDTYRLVQDRLPGLLTGA